MVEFEIIDFLKKNRGKSYTAIEISQNLKHNHRSVQRTLSKFINRKNIIIIIKMKNISKTSLHTCRYYKYE